jgi:hypothetical protein
VLLPGRIYFGFNRGAGFGHEGIPFPPLICGGMSYFCNAEYFTLPDMKNT